MSLNRRDFLENLKIFKLSENLNFINCDFTVTTLANEKRNLLGVKMFVGIIENYL